MRMNATNSCRGRGRYVLDVTAPGPMTVLFDGACPFCTRSARAIQRVFGVESVTLRDFQQPGALEPHPTVTLDALRAKMHVVMPDGRVFAGAEAFARIVARVPVLGWMAWLYYVPGARQIADAAYAWVAKHRYRLFRRTACTSGTCQKHGAPQG
jgi:predicted DCC family thiol-disulfide oxidoreductase YuxK